MRINNIFAILCSALVGLGCINAQVWGGGCDEKEPRTASVDAAGAALVRVQGEAGWLKIRGAEGASSVEVDGEACASSQKRLDEIKLVAERRGEEVVIEADLPDGWGGGALDLDITVPADLPIVARDGSGAVEIRGVASLELRDGSGGVEIEDVAGDVRVQDGSGGLEISNVDGSVTVSDGSGGIEIRQVGADVLVERDGSGGIRVTDVGGDLIVERDGSGGVDYERIAGDTRVSE